MNKGSKDTLDTLERLLISDMANPREALEAAFRLGQIEGQLEQARINEFVLSELMKVAECASEA